LAASSTRFALLAGYSPLELSKPTAVLKVRQAASSKVPPPSTVAPPSRFGSPKQQRARLRQRTCPSFCW
jgi:hypothetical protein